MCLNELMPSHLDHLNLGLETHFDFKVTISLGRFWLQAGDDSKSVIKGGTLVKEVWSMAKAGHELLEDMKENAEGQPQPEPK